MTKTLALAIALGLTTGCLSIGTAADEGSVLDTLYTFKESIESEDIDKAMSVYSEKFETANGEDKAASRAFFERAGDQGYLEHAEVSLERTVIRLDGKTAVAEPVGLMSPAGGMDLSITLRNENGRWKFISAKEF